MPAPANFPTFRYLRPDEWWTLDAAVTGATDAEHDINYLIDLIPGRPWLASGLTGDAAFDATSAAGDIDIVALCHTNLDDDAVCALSGDLTAADIPGPPLPPNRIPLNRFLLVTASGVDHLAVTITGNALPVTIGQFVAGPLRTLPVPKQAGETFDESHITVEADAEEVSSVPGYSRGAKRRHWGGQQYYTAAQVADFRDWFDATQAGADDVLPSLIVVPDPTISGGLDARLVKFVLFHYEPAESGDLFLITLDFEEYPRSRT